MFETKILDRMLPNLVSEKIQFRGKRRMKRQENGDNNREQQASGNGGDGRHKKDSNIRHAPRTALGRANVKKSQSKR